ncbi:hypothetical protein FDP41_013022 [Naegleria fowleri]|uniref:DUF962 domain-containing protein n=1 Tax=Naegleria fowleri TaxID=5763 RepID=A0A6A5C408_NAEFO|nr:uncharacterized protein FDP41_013022 [Naegleria fowleri]KAF0981234.1 hypothetical protein FDP41_013022 [Naegleria fowleri]
MSSSSTANSSDTVKRGSLFSRIFSVSDQFVNYYYYHQSPTNQMIHFVFVPVIALSLIMLCFKVDLQHVDTVRWLIVDVLKLSSEWCNLAVLVSAVLMVYYLILDRIAGFLLSLEFFGMVVLSHYFHLRWIHSPSTYYWFAVIIQVIGWATQFYGHYLEGKRPALIDNVFQIFIAPLFVLFELLFCWVFVWI